MNFTRQLTTALAIAVLGIGCAKQRPVEVTKDPEGDNLSKDAFTIGMNAAKPERKVWNSKVTVVRTSTNGGFSFIGYQSENRIGYFDFSRDQLRFYDAVSLNEPVRSALPELINAWEITHHDYKLTETDGNVTTKESADPDKRFEQKRYFKVNFSKANISEAATFPSNYWSMKGDCWSQSASRLVDNSLKIEPDSIAFTIAVDYEQDAACTTAKRMAQGDLTYTVHYKYSFWARQPSENFAPQAYKGENDPEMKRYGFFQSVFEFMDKKTGLPKNIILKNHWNPNRDFVDIYYAPGFPEDMKWYFNDPKIGVIARTNEVMQKAGAKVRFRIWNNEDGPDGQKGKVKEFGDGRYSFVNFIDEIDPNAPLGYGPSDADPVTGEIISSNTIIWTGYLKYYLKVIAGQQARFPNQTEKSTLYKHMKLVMGESDVSTWKNNFDMTKGYGKAYHELLPEITYGYPYWARFTSKTAMSPVAMQTAAANFFPMTSLDRMERWIPDNSKAISEMQRLGKEAKGAIGDMLRQTSSGRTTQTYPLAPVLAQVQNGTITVLDPQKVLASLIHRVAIHEFGHNLGLRHNFYGSVDAANFGHYDENSEPTTVEAKSNKTSYTSSVMDYMDLEHEMDVAKNWEPYDIAALRYTYSGRTKDDAKTYLFCTDEHTILNALCNQFDVGSTPTEVVASIIRSYDDSYWTRNYRFDRQYWNTWAYDSGVFRTMYTMKKFLPLWRRALDENTIRQELERKGGMKPEEITETVAMIGADAKQAVRLTVAFYDAVIQQKMSDRPYATEYEPFSGETKRIGILPDKVYAMMMFMGNDEIPYNPNRRMSETAFMTYKGEPELAKLLNEIFENQLTTRVDMEPWFINFSRYLYSVTATGSMNIEDSQNLDRIKVVRFTQKEMKALFNISVEKDRPAELLRLKKSEAAAFRADEPIGYAEINGLYYVVSQERNPYAFGVVRSIVQADEAGDSTVLAKADLLELYNLYMYARGDSR